MWLTLVHILLALWAWLANSTQMINLLLDRNLRRQPRTALLIGVSVAELLVAGLLCPLYTDSLLRGPWRHGVVTCSTYEAIFYLQVCISSLAVLVLNVERFYFLLAPGMLQGAGKRRVTALLTILPWVVGLLVVVPLYTRGAHATLDHVPGLHHRTCVVHWRRDLHVLTVFVSFLAPAFLLLATAVAVLLLYVISAMRAHESLSEAPLSRDATHHTTNSAWGPQNGTPGGSMDGGPRRGRIARLTELDAKTRRECMLAVLASSMLCVVLQFPFFAVLLLQLFCQQPAPSTAPSDSRASLLPDAALGSHPDPRDCHFSDTVWAAVMMTGMAKPGIMPLVWLIYSDIRAGLKLGACACSCAWRRVCRFQDTRREENGGTSSAGNSLPSLASQMTVV
nr:hypothetical protein BaRGS_008017 [Batillaria attramentaria]